MNVRRRILSAGLSAIFALSGMGLAYAQTPPVEEDSIQTFAQTLYSQVVHSPATAEIDTASLIKYGSTTYKVVVKNRGEQYGSVYTVEGTSNSVTIPAESYTKLQDIEAVEVMPVYRFDLGSLTNVEPGMTGVDAATSFAAKGYGFADTSAVANDTVPGGAGAGSDSVYCKTSGTGSFDVTLENGEYGVTIMNGRSGRVSPWAEGMSMGNDMFMTNEKRAMQIMVEDGALNLQIRNGNAGSTSWALSYVEIVKTSQLEKRRINVFLGGDSTVYGYAPNRTDYAGVGQMLPLFMPEKEFVVANYGIQGDTTQIYLDSETRFPTIEKRLQPGDYYLIQLGINDQSRSGYTITKEQYGDNLRTMVTRTRAKGAVPVLITPQGHYSEVYRMYYSDMMEEVAQEMEVPLIDNRVLVGDFYTALGGSNAPDVAPYIAIKNVDETTGAVSRDGLHLSPQGALNCARSVAERLRIQIPEVFGSLYTTTRDGAKLNPLYNADLKVNFDQNKVIAKAQMQWLGVENAPEVKTFVGLYDASDNLITVKSRTMQLENYSSENCTAPITATLIWDDISDAAYAKMFVWDAPGGARQMKPLTHAVLAEESNFVPDGTETETPQTPDAPLYNRIMIDSAMTGGTVATDKTAAVAGDTVNVTVTPADSYQLKAGTLKYNGNPINEQTLTFIMPDEEVTITAEFETEQGIVINQPKVVAEEDFSKLPSSWNFTTSSSNASYHVDYVDYVGALTMNRNTNADGSGGYSRTGDTVTAAFSQSFDGILKVEYDMKTPNTGRTGDLGLYSGEDLIFKANYNASTIGYTVSDGDETRGSMNLSDWLRFSLLIDTHGKTVSGTITSLADGSAITIPETALNRAVMKFDRIIAKANSNIGGVAMDNFKVTQYATGAEMASIDAVDMTLNDKDHTAGTATVSLPKGWRLLSAVSADSAVATAQLTDAHAGTVAVKALKAGNTEVDFVAQLNGTDYTVSGAFDVMVTSSTPFAVTVAGGIKNGTISTNKTAALMGEIVKVTVTPEDGYRLKTGSLKYNGTAIDEQTLTFVMPNGNVTVTGEFEEISSVIINPPVVVAEEDFTELPSSWTFSKSSSNATYHVNYKDYAGALTMNRNTNADGSGGYSREGDTVKAAFAKGVDGIIKVEYDMIEPSLLESKPRTGKLGLLGGTDVIFESHNDKTNVMYAINGATTTAKITTNAGGKPAWLSYSLFIDTYNKTISGTITSKADNSTVTIPETKLADSITQFDSLVATANINIGGIAIDNFKVTQYATGAEMASIKADDITNINDTDNTTTTAAVTVPKGWSLLSAVSNKPAVATATVTDAATGTVTIVGQPGGGLTNVRYVVGLNGTDYKVSGSFSVMVDSDKSWIDSLAAFHVQAQGGNVQDYNPAQAKILTMEIVDPKDGEGNVLPVYAEDFVWAVDTASAEKGVTVNGSQVVIPQGLTVSMSAPVTITVTATGTKTDNTTVIKSTEITLNKAFTYLYGPVDYEDGSTGGWTNTLNVGTYENVKDTTEGISNYMRFRGTNGRSYILTLPTAITQDFVFEADMSIMRDSQVGEFALLSSAATYDNKNISNKGGYVLKLDMPSDQNVLILNNPETQISMGSPFSDFAQPAIVSEQFPSSSTGWMHVKVLGNFTKRVVNVEITSLDGAKTYFNGQADMSDSPEATDVKKLLFFSGKNDSTHQKIDNVSFRLAEPEELEDATYYNVAVTTDLGALQTTNSYYIKKNGFVTLTDHATVGYDFKGWKVNEEDTVYTTAQINAMPITADTKIVAQYTIKSGYNEPLESVDFLSFPANNTLVMSGDESFHSNLLALAVTGERKTDFSVTDDTKILWEFTGFRTMPGGQPTGDPSGDFALNGTFPNTQTYCDSYATVTVDSMDDPSIEFMLKNTSMNFYGRVKATVTYKEQTMSVERPLIILGNTAKTSGQLLPAAGYPADYKEYEDLSGTFGDYVSEYAGNKEVYLGNWSVLDSSMSKTLSLRSEEGSKFLRLAKGVSGSVARNTIEPVTQQTIFSQEVRFGGEGDRFTLSTKDVSASSNEVAFEVSYSGGKIKLNNTEAVSASANTWYKIVVSADSSTGKCYAKVYDLEGNKLGETVVTNFKSACSGPTVYSFISGAGNLDFNNVTAVAAKVNDDESFTLQAAPSENLTIPTGDAAATVTLTAAAFTTDSGGADTYPATGTAVWTIEDPGVQETDVQIVPDPNNSAVAVVSVYKTAASGTLPVSVHIGGVTRTVNLKLTGTADSLAFTSAPNSLLIPASGSAEYTFAGEVRGGDGSVKPGTVTYAIYDKDNAAPVNNPAAAYGITLDSNTGKLTVGADATPAQFTVRATSGALSRGVAVNMYNWKFDFGSGADDAVMQGYTSVSPVDFYSDAKGYGIVGTATAGTSGEDILKEDYLAGTGLSFRVKVQKGKIYNVSVGYQGSLTLEAASTGLFSIPGIEKANHTSLTEEQFSVAVVGDGVLDINVSGQVSHVSVTAQEDKVSGTKPTWISTGDSTVAQNPSWAYILAGNESAYPALYDTVNFANKGRGARHLTSYYTEGLFDGVLQTIRPGDIVSLTGWGTNYSSGSVTNAQFKEYLEYYIDAVEDMGAYVILGSYSSEGSWCGDTYDEVSLTFKGSRLTRGIYYDVINKQVYDERSQTDDKIIGFIDVGAICDEFMTAKVRKAYKDVMDQGGSAAEAQAAADALADAMYREYWPKDQHYTKPLADLILADLKPEDGAVSDSVTQKGKGIVSQALEMIQQKVIPEFTPGA